MDPERYYDDFAEGEWERLVANPVARLEFEGAVDYLERHLQTDGYVLDAGGGPGRYTAWLAERGHDVAHFDLSREQARIARERLADRDLDRHARVARADLRGIPFESNAFDAGCCLGGALSHVVDADDRKRALAKLRRVAAPGAPAFVSVIGRLAALRDTIKRVVEGNHGLLVPLAENGDYTAGLLED